MTYEELLSRVVDLGFEEDEVTEEYARLIRNAINQASGIIYSTVALQIEGYLLRGTEDTEITPFTTVTEDTDEETDMNVPRILEPLLPLLTAHYVWLDDDLTKATYYYNEYDSLKQEIIASAFRPRKVEIVGGF